MKYQELFSMEQFAELYDASNGIYKRRLQDNQNIQTYIYKKPLFEYNDIAGAELKLILKDDSGINSETMKTHSDFIHDNNQADIIHIDQSSDLTNILKKLIRLSRAGNHLATQLYNNIKKYFARDFN